MVLPCFNRSSSRTKQQSVGTGSYHAYGVGDNPTVADLLGQPDAAVRGWAIDRLAAHGGDSARARLSTYLPHETVPELRARIDAALHAPKP